MNRNDVQWDNERPAVRGSYKAFSIEEVQKDPKRSVLGQGRGLSFSFREGEIVHFPPVEKAWPIFKPFAGTEVMYITAFSETRGRKVDIALSTFRRIPAGDGEVDIFFDESIRPLNCELASMDTDLQRLIHLCTIGTIKCDELVDAHAAVFEQGTDGKPHRVKDEYRDIRLASVQKMD